TEYKILKIKFADILYIEGLKEYVKIVVGNNKPILSLLTLKHLEEKLPQNYFMRVHRSFIVNLHQVKTIERGRIIFNKVNIPISEPYKVIFQKFLDNNFI
ncbi:MAG TPA: LytTR family DNA-binding domain-containing protein, partial [Bacteroidales bacterium]|nr:LytTR family DNA-binding domain-containing protein [Bacteroidales bacterium]